jgi:ABC-type multidrug transport system fused ATPase/permease subunit
MSGLGRLEFGTHQAMSFRYTSISSLLWIVNSVFLFFIISKYKDSVLIKQSQRIINAIAIIIIIFMAISLIRTSYRVGYSVLRKYHETLEPIREKITGEMSDEELKKVYIHTDHVRYCLGILKKHHLSVYREE